MTDKETKAVQPEMKPMNLDPRAVAALEAIPGVHMVVYARLLKDATSQNGKEILFQTEAELSEKAKSDSVETKMGTILKMKGAETELSCTSFIARGGQEDQYKWLTEAFRNKEKFELWLVDVKSKDSGSQKYNAQYFHAQISELKSKAGAEDYFTLDCTFAIEGQGKFGQTALNVEDQESADYDFKEVVNGE